ncbi:MAG: DASS family sodium-coupled anion symporter [Methanomicrobiales archaeon]
MIGGINTNLKKYGLPLAIIAAAIVMLIPLEGLSAAGHASIALLVFAVIMWGTETVPLAVTSLIILFIQPILGIESFDNAVIGFANPILFLMIGGFIIAEAIRKSGLAKRITYIMLSKLGTSSNMTLLAAVFSTGIMSAWIENVVAFAMLLPVIKEVISLMGVKDAKWGKSNFAKAMVLGASYGSLAGGLGTEIGTAPNLMAAAYTQIPFLEWMIFGFPLAIVLMFVIWKVLGIIFPSEVKEIKGGKEAINSTLTNMGPMTRNEKFALVILLFTIFLWVTTQFTGLNSYSIALIGATLFFIFGIVDWKDAQKNVDWGLIVFFGGALSLGAALLNTGAANWLIQDLVGLVGSDPSTLLMTVILMVIAVVLTQVMSNIALSAVLIPLSVTFEGATGLPVGTYAVPVAISCSLSFLFPMADPTVAMAHGTGYISVKEIIKAGIPMIIIGIALTLVVVFTIARPVLAGI